MSNLAALEELAVKCHHSVSRIYIEEAIGSYNAGSARAAIVTTWIAVYFDLVAKIRSLSLSGVDEARQWIAKYDEELARYEPENTDTARPLQTRENRILNDASSVFGLVTSMELTDLKRLRSDRHRCAHPAYKSTEELFTPSAEQARLHLRNALEFVLTRPAIQGQMAVDRTMELIRDEGFPNTKEDASEVLRASSLLDLKSDERSLVVRSVLSDLFARVTPGPKRLQLMSALEGVRDIHPNWFAESFGRLISEHIAHDKPLVVFLVTSYARSRPWLMQHVDSISMGRIKHLLTNIPFEDDFGKEAILSALWIDATREWAENRVHHIPSEFIEKSKDRIPKDVWIEQAVRRIETSERVESTYSVFHRQLGGLIEMSELSRDQVTRILQATVKKEAVRESIATPTFFEQLLDHPFRDNNEPKFFWKRAIEALRVSDATKARLIEKVEEMNQSIVDMDDVPF